MYSDRARNQAGRSWKAKLAAYFAAAAATGMAAGGLLGALGSVLPLSVRVTLAAILGVIAIALGGLELTPRRVRPLQRRCETPQSWMRRGALSWAVSNGVTLGLGATTRIGFWLWFAIPAAAILYADILAGAMIYGVYGALRAGLVWPMIQFQRRTENPEMSLSLLKRQPQIRRLAGSVLLLTGVVVVGSTMV